MAELTPYLMVPSGKQIHLQKVISFGAAKISVSEFCQFGISVSACRDIGFVLFLVAYKHIFQQSALLSRLVAAQSPVSLVYFSVPEHRAQPLKRLACFSQYAYSAYRSVQAMGNAEVHLSRLVVTFGDECLVVVCQAFVARLVSLGYLANLLANNKKVIVFEQYPALQVGVFFVAQLSVFHNAKIMK